MTAVLIAALVHREAVHIQVIIGILVVIGASTGGKIFIREKIRLTVRPPDADNKKRKDKKMAKETKATADYMETFDKLDIRVGRIIEVEIETSTPKKTYRMVIDFGKYGRKTSYGRFTMTPAEEVKNRLVLGVLNFGTKKMGPVESEVLVLGVQYPKAESGEAAFVSPSADCKIGSKLF